MCSAESGCGAQSQFLIGTERCVGVSAGGALEALAYNFFITAYVFALVAATAYLAQPLWPRVAYRSAETTAGTSMTIASPSEPPPALGPLATGASWLVLASLTLSLAFRWAAAGHPPYANMYEYRS